MGVLSQIYGRVITFIWTNNHKIYLYKLVNKFIHLNSKKNISEQNFVDRILYIRTDCHHKRTKNLTYMVRKSQYMDKKSRNKDSLSPG